MTEPKEGGIRRDDQEAAVKAITEGKAAYLRGTDIFGRPLSLPDGLTREQANLIFSQYEYRFSVAISLGFWAGVRYVRGQRKNLIAEGRPHETTNEGVSPT